MTGRPGDSGTNVFYNFTLLNAEQPRPQFPRTLRHTWLRTLSVKDSSGSRMQLETCSDDSCNYYSIAKECMQTGLLKETTAKQL